MWGIFGGPNIVTPRFAGPRKNPLFKASTPGQAGHSNLKNKNDQPKTGIITVILAD